MLWLNDILGVRLLVHEKGHEIAYQLLYDDVTGRIHVDAHDNLRNLARDPNPETFTKVVTNHDTEAFGGYYALSSKGSPSLLGQKLTGKQRDLVGLAAGSVVEALLPLGAFVSGFMLRKKKPLPGYSLMLFGTLGYLRALLYPAAAAFPAARAAGGDWAGIHDGVIGLGIHPAVTAVVFASGLPLVAAGLYAVEKHRESKMKDRIALANLLRSGGISPAEQSLALQDYPGTASLSAVEQRLLSLAAEVPRAGPDRSFLQRLAGTLKAAQKEDEKFSKFLIRRFPEQVRAERAELEKRMPRMSLRQAVGEAGSSLAQKWQEDKTGAVLQGVSGTTTGSVLGLSLLRTIPDLILRMKHITPTNMPEAFRGLSGASASFGAGLKAAVPLAGLAGLACSYCLAGTLLRNRDAGKLDKVAAAISAAFASVSAAGILVPGVGVPLLLAGIGGQLATWVGKSLLRRWRDHREQPPPEPSKLPLES